MGNHVFSLSEAERKTVADLVNASDLPYKAKAYTEEEEQEEPMLAQVQQKKTFGEDTKEFKDALAIA